MLFLGGTIGNFDREEAVRFLADIRYRLRPGDGLLVGADLMKPVATLLAAYDDALGVTAAFNRNVLNHVNRILDSDFDASAYAHRSVYDTEAGRIEMHLVATRAQQVRIPGMAPVRFAKGETLRTEISCKHDRDSVAELFASAGLRIEAWRTDPGSLFALVTGAPV